MGKRTVEPDFYLAKINGELIQCSATSDGALPCVLIDKAEMLLLDLRTAQNKAEQYEKDWYAAKSEFGTAMAKMKRKHDEEVVALKGKLNMLAVVATTWRGDVPASEVCSEIKRVLKL